MPEETLQELRDQLQQLKIQNKILLHMVLDAQSHMAKHPNEALVRRWFSDLRSVREVTP